MSSLRPPSPLVAALAAALPATAPAQTTHLIEEGQAQVVAAFADSTEWIRHHLWVETEFDTDGDGRPDRLHVDVTRPAQTETEGLRVPVIYETSPYYSGVSGLDFDHFWDLSQEVGGEPTPRDPFPPTIAHIADQPIISGSHIGTWVPRGFAVVHSQSPGTGQSDGCPTMGGANESLAPKAVVDWLNGRARGFTTPDGAEEVTAEWATGKVGMTGTSFNGTLPLAAATTGVEGLEAIVPIAPNTSYYHYYRSNGLVRSPGGYPGEDIDVLFDFVLSGDPEDRDYCIANARGELEAELDRVSGDYSDFWAARDYLNHIDGVRAATLMAHGFNDWNVMPEHSYRITEALKERGVPVQIYYHQDGHGGPPPLAMMNRWFTRYLLGVENGVEDDPRAWIVRAGDERDDPTPYPDYPHPDAEEIVLHPSAPGNAVGALSLHAAESAVVETLVDDHSLPGADLAALETSRHRLLYATPPLERDLHISGVPRVRIRVAADATAANLTVWLVALPWTPEPDHIGENVITKGWADPRNAGDPRIGTPRTGSPLAPGEFVEFEFALQPDDQVIPAGARIGLMILSSDQNFTVHPTPGTELSVELSGTWLTLPVVGGAAALSGASR
ncbi:MAG: Xaa-Pro dipeptidyl-peptidase [Gemmatimonadetes bacterium]|nr:Xaa-Pro dipeptidyl-peptidase [Gemmatimonadota bacterium]MCY3943898.1 Xaa-Pro dipeptidyl-peptidase [Gemmatimonadota bacterium]